MNKHTSVTRKRGAPTWASLCRYPSSYITLYIIGKGIGYRVEHLFIQVPLHIMIPDYLLKTRWRRWKQSRKLPNISQRFGVQQLLYGWIGLWDKVWDNNKAPSKSFGMILWCNRDTHMCTASAIFVNSKSDLECGILHRYVCKSRIIPNIKVSSSAFSGSSEPHLVE